MVGIVQTERHSVVYDFSLMHSQGGLPTPAFGLEESLENENWKDGNKNILGLEMQFAGHGGMSFPNKMTRKDLPGWQKEVQPNKTDQQWQIPAKGDF